jgi:putative two-component system response regulator
VREVELEPFDDPCDAQHGARVALLADTFAACLGWDERRRSCVRLGGTVHDLGKLTVNPAILRKPGALNELELAEVRLHPSSGAWIAAPIRSLHAVLPCILLHHERWDGLGYPAGRRGAETPTEARLLAIVDAYDAMVSDRPYRRAMPIADALSEIQRGSGSQFDPELARAFVAWHDSVVRASPRPRASIAFA